MKRLWWTDEGRELERQEARVREEAVERAIARHQEALRRAGYEGVEPVTSKPARRF